MFRTKYDRIRVTTNAGDPYLDCYKNSIDDNGNTILIKDKKKDNIDEKIQAERDSCDLKRILARLTKSEIERIDLSHGGMFGDFTQVPKSLHDLRQRLMDADNMFKSLPLEVREKFDFSTDKFFASVGSDYYNDVMKHYVEPVEEKVVVDPVVDKEVTEE